MIKFLPQFVLSYAFLSEISSIDSMIIIMHGENLTGIVNYSTMTLYLILYNII